MEAVSYTHLVELLRKDSPVARRLIEHEDKIRVFKDILHFAGSKQILDILRKDVYKRQGYALSRRATSIRWKFRKTTG